MGCSGEQGCSKSVTSRLYRGMEDFIKLALRRIDEREVVVRIEFADHARTLRRSLRSLARDREIILAIPAMIQKGERGCWLWLGQTSKGYARIRSGTAGRFILDLLLGEMPKDRMACHHCDTPRCINPNHLYAGTAKDNARDCNLRHPRPPRLNLKIFTKPKTLHIDSHGA